MKKRIRIGAALLCAALLLLSSCALVRQKNSGPPEGAYKVYFAVTGEKKSAAQSVDFEYRVLSEGADPVLALAEAVLAGPQDADTDLASPMPAGVRLRSVTLGEDGQLHLNLSEQYGGLSGVDLTVANACLVLTLGQAPGVDDVYITVEGEPIPFQSLKTLRTGDFLLPTGDEEPTSATVRLFFPKADGTGLGVEERKVSVGASNSLTAAVVSALLAGPEGDGLHAIAPKGVSLRWTRVEDGVCFVSLSESFYAGAAVEEHAARLTLYAIVDSLCALEGAGVEQVEFLMEGGVVSLYGSIPLGAPLPPDYGLAMEEKTP